MNTISIDQIHQLNKQIQKTENSAYIQTKKEISHTYAGLIPILAAALLGVATLNELYKRSARGERALYKGLLKEYGIKLPLKTKADIITAKVALYLLDHSDKEKKAANDLTDQITDMVEDAFDADSIDSSIANDAKTTLDTYINENKVKQAQKITLEIARDLAAEDVPDISNIVKKQGQIAGNTWHRLIYTQDTQTLNLSMFSAADTECYKYVTARDSGVCTDCAALDDLVIPYKNMIIGINYPPIHPWCRCLAVPTELKTTN